MGIYSNLLRLLFPRLYDEAHLTTPYQYPARPGRFSGVRAAKRAAAKRRNKRMHNQH